jgi:hypothetical protein
MSKRRREAFTRRALLLLRLKAGVGVPLAEVRRTAALVAGIPAAIGCRKPCIAAVVCLDLASLAAAGACVLPWG